MSCLECGSFDMKDHYLCVKCSEKYAQIGGQVEKELKEHKQKEKEKIQKVEVNKSMLIYKVTNKVNGKVYIGQTKTSLKDRMWRHKGTYLHKNYTHLSFYKALKEYGLDSFDWEVIETVRTIEELNEREKYWIRQYNSFGDGGYNSTRGGNGLSGHKHSDISLKKMSEVHLGVKQTDEAKAKQSKSMIGVNAGSKSGLSKLHEDDVREIKRLLVEGITKQKDIAAMFNVNKATITFIKNGSRWGHIE